MSWQAKWQVEKTLRNKKRHTYYYVLHDTPVMENRKVEPANSLVFSTM